MNSLDGRRLKTASLALVLVAPAATFFVSAIGRSLQPVAHEPARTLDGIVRWFEDLSGIGATILLIVFPMVGLALAAALLWRTWSGDEPLHADVAALVLAASRIARRPALLISILVLVLGSLYFVAVTIHAIAG